MNDQAIWLSEEDVGELVSINTGIEALRLQLPREAAGGAQNLSKVLATWDSRSSMHNLGSIDAERGFGGVKSWINTPNGAQAVYVLFDAHEGKLLALMDAGTLGSLRTAGISGLATSVMAAPDADGLSIIGTGRQALAQVAAISTVRHLKTIHVYSPTEVNKQAFCNKLRSEFGAEIIAQPNLESAVRAAPILTLVTRARLPFVSAGMLEPGTHVNAVGAILPGHAELEQDVLDRFDQIVVDNIPNAKIASAELIGHFGKDEAAWARVQTLGDLISAGTYTYQSDNTTCFKAMGMGLSDLAIAIAVYVRAQEQGRGRPLGSSRANRMHWNALSAQNENHAAARAQ